MSAEMDSRPARMLRAPASRACAALIMLAGLVASAGTAMAQSMDDRRWVTNGTVNAVVHSGNTVYTGGSFTRVGPSTGGAVPLDATSGLLPASFPKVDGTVYAVATDGSGNWYIGGAFTSVGGLYRTNLARVRSDMSVSAWSPYANDVVRAIAISGPSIIAGGDFTFIGGGLRNRVAAIDTSAGLALAWNPNANGPVHALKAYDPNIYVGGAFTTIGGVTRRRLAAVHYVTAALSSWNPNADSTVFAIERNLATVYAGGLFTHLGVTTRNNIAAVDTLTGAPTSWNPNANGNPVYALLLGNGVIYAGGSFVMMGGLTRNRVAAIRTATGTVTGWNPAATGTVFSLARGGISFNPSKVYVGGSFLTIGGSPREYAAALDTAAGTALPWNPMASNTVRALVGDGTTVYAGGAFTMMNTLQRNNIAAFDATTGTATFWNPDANGSVFALATKGTTVYAGGAFTMIGAQPRNRIAALDSAGVATSFNPNASGHVNALAIGNHRIYAGGGFTTIGGAGRNRVAALTLSGVATGWNPNASDSVKAMLVDGSRVYLGGLFTTIGGIGRNRIASLDTSGTLRSWNPNAGGAVRALALSDSTLYVGGSFASVGVSSRSRIAALNTRTGIATGWDPIADNDVYALTLNGPVIYAGGRFSTIAGMPQQRIAALDRATGAYVFWLDHIPRPNGDVNGIAVNGATVHVGGGFTILHGITQPFLAAVSAAPTISRVVPDSAGPGPVTVTIFGCGFASNFTAQMSCYSGPPVSIPGTSTSVAADGLSLTATFDFTTALVCTLGLMDVKVEDPDSMRATRSAAFTVAPVAGAQLRLNVVGPAAVRSGRLAAYDVVLENRGNVDALYVPLWIAGIPPGATVDLDFPLAAPPQGGGEHDWTAVPRTFSSPTGEYLPLVIPRVPPGFSYRRFLVTTSQSFTLRVATTPPWVDGGLFRNCLVNGGISDPACMGAQLTALNAHLDANPSIVAMSGTAVWAKVAHLCETHGTLTAARVKAQQVLGYMLRSVDTPATAIAACASVLPPRWRDSLAITVVMSHDPNEKFGSRDSVSLQQPIPYFINFENDPAYTAPAQQVIISDPLDPALCDPATVTFGPITFGSHVILPVLGSPQVLTTVPMPERGVNVTVNGSVDPISNTVQWFFVSTRMDGQPLGALEGFLPPNTTPPQGEGRVSFTVMPRGNLAGGTLIRNGASIIFDDNVPDETNFWYNNVDNVLARSHVTALSSPSNQTAITVQWVPDVPASDLRDYTIYVKEDGAPYRVWRLNTIVTSDTLKPPGNHHAHDYSFYSVARDIAGNIEPPPTTADATVQSRLAADAPASPALALHGAWPNPAVGFLRVRFTLPSRERAILDLVDVAGRRVLRRDVGALGPGTHSVALDASPPLRPGLYFIRLTQGARALTGRVALVR